MDRSTALIALAEGNIFHATTPNGASFICLVTSVNSQICARRVTTQEQFVFDRVAGIAEIGDASAPGTIDSVAPLPVEIRQVHAATRPEIRSGRRSSTAEEGNRRAGVRWRVLPDPFVIN